MLQFDLQFYEELTVAWVRTVKFISGAFFWPTGQLVFYCDNQAIVAVINKQTSKDNIIMSLIRSLVVACLKYNIMFVAKHIPGKHNVIADLLSRSQFTAAQKINPALDKTPQQIPATWLPW